MNKIQMMLNIAVVGFAIFITIYLYDNFGMIGLFSIVVIAILLSLAKYCVGATTNG